MPRGEQGPLKRRREELLASPGKVPPDTSYPIPPRHAVSNRTLFSSEVPRLPEVPMRGGFQARHFMKTPAKPSQLAFAPGSLSEAALQRSAKWSQEGEVWLGRRLVNKEMGKLNAAMGYLDKKDKELEDKIKKGGEHNTTQVVRPREAQAVGLPTTTVSGFQSVPAVSRPSRTLFSQTQYLVEVAERGESSASCSKVKTDDSKELICLLDKFQAEINDGEQIKIDVESESFRKHIGATEDLFDKQRMLARSFVQTKKEEIAMLITGVEEAMRDKTKKYEELVKLDLERAQIVRDCEEKEELVEQLTKKKRKFKESITKNIAAFKEVIGMLEIKLEDLKTKHEDKKQKIGEQVEIGPNMALLDYISKKIEAKEGDLECPVCFEVASAPIFMCSSEHLVCSGCRDKLSRCPECRKIYSKERKKHRFAEKAAEELEVLYRERAEVLGD